jgi:hypothetical protein
MGVVVSVKIQRVSRFNPVSGTYITVVSSFIPSHIGPSLLIYLCEIIVDYTYTLHATK